MFRARPKTAAEWFVRLSAGPISAGDKRALARWLAGKPDRLREFENINLLWRISGSLDGSQIARSYLANDISLKEKPTSRSRKKALRHVYIPSALAAALAVLVAIGMPQIEKMLYGPWLSNGRTAHTTLNQITTYKLPDGSVLTLAAASSVRVSFTKKERVIFLDDGEGFFDVKHIPGHPFIVVTGNKRVQVTGTQFNVDYYSARHSMEVAVVAGRINVISSGPAHDMGGATSVGASEVFLFPANGSAVRRPLSAEHASAWRRRKLYFDDATLADVLAGVNRYSKKPLVAGSPEIAQLTLSGMFDAGDVKSVLLSLNDLYGLKGRETQDAWLLVQDHQPTRAN
jgi:transmembrane sensor